MGDSNFILPEYELRLIPGKTSWKAPSNIALIKYWGKMGEQIPANPSISFTLSKSATITTLSYSPLETETDEFSYELYFEGERNEDFRPKIDQFLNRINPYLPFLKQFHFKIETSNSFPHSSGIASSASGFAALALCFLEIERTMNTSMEENYFYNKASFLARLGSGSASRSIEGPLMQWGSHKGIEESSDLFAIPFPPHINSVFNRYQDAILLVDSGKKSVSSTAGHGLMHGHWYAQQRFEQARANLDRMVKILKSGDLDGFIQIVESEALSLHSMMMTSIPYFLLMKPNTVAIIQKVWEYREQTGSKLCFTLDAGANVHLLFPESEKANCYEFIEIELLKFCSEGGYLRDESGTGSEKLM